MWSNMVEGAREEWKQRVESLVSWLIGGMVDAEEGGAGFLGVHGE